MKSRSPRHLVPDAAPVPAVASRGSTRLTVGVLRAAAGPAFRQLPPWTGVRTAPAPAPAVGVAASRTWRVTRNAGRGSVQTKSAERAAASEGGAANWAQCSDARRQAVAMETAGDRASARRDPRPRAQSSGPVPSDSGHDSRHFFARRHSGSGPAAQPGAAPASRRLYSRRGVVGARGPQPRLELDASHPLRGTPGPAHPTPHYVRRETRARGPPHRKTERNGRATLPKKQICRVRTATGS